jgi:hypothetical protein
MRASRVAVLLALGSLGCRGAGHEAAPRPRASASAKPPTASSPCSDGGGTIADPRFVTWFPRAAGGFCLDPNADQRVFGARSPLPLADAAELIGIDSERLERSGVLEVVALSYVEANSEPGHVGVSVLGFTSAETALAFYTARVAEALELAHPNYVAFAAGAVAVRGETTALVVRDKAVARLEYTNARLPPTRVVTAAAPALEELGRAIAGGLPGPATLPPAARLLPEAERVPLSLRYDAGDLAGFEGIGPGASAVYSDGKRRYRLALAVRLDADAAKDVLSTLKKREGARVLKQAPYEALRAGESDEKSGVVREWIFGRKGSLVAGVALDAPPRAAPRGAPPERQAAVLKLKRLLDRLPAAVAW